MGVEFTCQPELKDGRAGRARARERERKRERRSASSPRLPAIEASCGPVNSHFEEPGVSTSTLDHPSCIRANSNFLLRVIHVNGSRGYSARVDHDSFLFSFPSFLLFSIRGWFAKRKVARINFLRRTNSIRVSFMNRDRRNQDYDRFVRIPSMINPR